MQEAGHLLEGSWRFLTGLLPVLSLLPDCLHHVAAAPHSCWSTLDFSCHSGLLCREGCETPLLQHLASARCHCHVDEKSRWIWQPLTSKPVTGAVLYLLKCLFLPRSLALPNRRPPSFPSFLLRLAGLTEPSDFRIELWKQNFPNPNTCLGQTPRNLFRFQGACHISVKCYLITDLLPSLTERVSAMGISTYDFTFSTNLVWQRHSINVCELNKLVPTLPDAVEVLERHTVVKINSLNYRCSIKTTSQI